MEHLFLEVVQVVPVSLVHLFRVAYNGIRVRLGVACHCDAKVLAILVPAMDIKTIGMRSQGSH